MDISLVVTVFLVLSLPLPLPVLLSSRSNSQRRHLLVQLAEKQTTQTPLALALKARQTDQN